MCGTVEERIATLEKTVAQIVEQFYRDGKWDRPVPPPVVYPETTAEILEATELPSMRSVFLNYRFQCSQCGESVARELSVSSQEPNPFSRLQICSQEHKTRVVFHVNKDKR